MDNSKVSGNRGVGQSTAKSSVKKGSEADKAAFSALVEQAQGKHGSADDSSSQQQRAFTQAIQTEQDASARGQQLVAELEALEHDILAGTPNQAIEKLQHTLATTPINRERLTPHQQKLLDEIEMRAAVEVAKAEAL